MWETDSECKFENTPVLYDSQVLLVVKIRLQCHASRIQDDSYDNTEIVTTNSKQVLACVTCILLPTEGLQEEMALQSYICEEADPLLYSDMFK
jgi:hypothetical protein